MTGSATARVVLHIGTPKTGTTYLQDLMWRNRSELGRRGVCYPGKYRESHFLAAMDLQGATVAEVGDPHLPWAWDRLVAEAVDARGTVVVSHELFSPMESDRVERALDAFGNTELHVVCTARDLARQLPAVWQEDLKNRHTLSFTEFLDAARDPGDGHWLGELFWRMQDVPAVLRRWAATLPPQQIHVVTVPPAGSPPDLLWRRFATVLGVDPDGLAVDGPVERNHSLGPAEAQLLRRLNLALPDDLPWWVYERTVRREFVDVLGRRRREPQRVAVPADHQPWVTERAKQLTAELAEAGYQVVGELDELIPSDVISSGVISSGVPAGQDPDEVTDSMLLDVALDAAREMVLRCGESIAQAQRPSLRQRIRYLGERNVAVRRLLAGYRSVRRPY